MSIQRQPGQSHGKPGLRRRIVVELTEQELPLLERAEAAHGSKRGAVLAALAGLEQADELEAERAALNARAEKAERAAAKTDGKESRDAKRQQAKIEKLEGELKAAKANLSKSTRAQASAAGQKETIERLTEELRETDEELKRREEEVWDLSDRAFDELYCARCESWVGGDEWAWQRSEEGGRIAYHKACGAHGPGVLASATWLGYRAG